MRKQAREELCVMVIFSLSSVLYIRRPRGWPLVPVLMLACRSLLLVVVLHFAPGAVDCRLVLQPPDRPPARLVSVSRSFARGARHGATCLPARPTCRLPV